MHLRFYSVLNEQGSRMSSLDNEVSKSVPHIILMSILEFFELKSSE